MSLTPRISLSPRHPFDSDYTSANPLLPGVQGNVETRGGMTAAYIRYGPNPYSLHSQYDDDSVLIAYNPVDTADTSSFTSYLDWARKCSVDIGFSGRNIFSHEQYLFIFRFQAVVESNWTAPTLQFFFGLNFLEQRQLAEGPDDVAILVDAPPTRGWRSIVVRLASDGAAAPTGFFFKGVDVYVL